MQDGEWPELRPTVVLMALLPRMPERDKGEGHRHEAEDPEQSLAATPRETGVRPIVAAARSLLMVVLAALAILGLLPVVVGVAAAP